MDNNQFVQIETIINDFVNEIKVSSQKRCVVMGEFLRTHTFVFDFFNAQTRQFIELRYGIKDGTYWTLDAIGSLMGCTRERVRQIEKEMLIELSKPYRLKLLKEYDDTTFDKSMLSDFKSLLSQDIINKMSDDALDFLQYIPVYFRYHSLFSRQNKVAPNA